MLILLQIQCVYLDEIFLDNYFFCLFCAEDGTTVTAAAVCVLVKIYTTNANWD